MPLKKSSTHVGIVGIGDVGAAIAYALILGSVCGQIIVVDTKQEFRDGQVLDLSDATYRGNSSTVIRAGTYQEAGQCDVVVITAGAKQKHGILFIKIFSFIPLNYKEANYGLATKVKAD
jgi:L-lactate dehydrogenase